MGDHDENIPFSRAAGIVGQRDAAELRRLTLKLFGKASERAAKAGILLADTKLEFGRDPGTDAITLADEAFTPDSSRFWPAESWRPGSSPPSFDKQYVRDWLTSPESGWDRRGDAAPPPLPDPVVAATRDRYVTAYERITGLSFADWPGSP